MLMRLFLCTTIKPPHQPRSLIETAFYGKFVEALIFYNFKELIYWGVLDVLRGEVL